MLRCLPRSSRGAAHPQLLLLLLSRHPKPHTPSNSSTTGLTSSSDHTLHTRTYSSNSSNSSSKAHRRNNVPVGLPSVCVWGANTGVGKTLISAGLVAAAVRNKVPVQYIKPVQTGYPADSDARLVASAAAAATSADATRRLLHYSDTLFAYSDPVSPHLAAAAEGRVAADGDIVAAVAAQMRAFVAGLAGRGVTGGGGVLQQQQQQQQQSVGLSVVETAGGVTSPGPSGTLQGDLLRPLALPALLVGDPKLGGISTTLSAYESLLLRGAHVAAVVMMTEGRYDNVTAVRQHLQHAAAHRLGQDLPVLALPLCQPPSAPNSSSDSSSSGGIDAELAAWLAASAPEFDKLLTILQQQHQQQLAWLQSAAGRASATVWWPFTQHAQLPNKDITVVDARAGEDWLVFKQQQQQSHQLASNNISSSSSSGSSSSSSSSSGSSGSSSSSSASSVHSVLTPLHDAASSWWTQTAAGPQQQLEVCRAVAAAAGRYMHVMWPQVAHAPGLALTEALLQGPLGKGWASRVFFSDDGSTAVEVALKMAFRKYMFDHGLTADELLASSSSSSSGDKEGVTLEVLALQNSYHGDTLGAMDCAAASPFNGPLQTPWYSGRGLFMEPPYMALVQGNWRLQQVPGWLKEASSAAAAAAAGGGGGSSSGSEEEWVWSSRAEAFDVKGRGRSQLAQVYRQYIESAIDAHESALHSATASSSSSSSNQRRRRRLLGALLMEPVLQGAGGMLLPDPLFQAELVKAAKRRRISVIYDEVFTGCWRLGVPTAGQLLAGGAGRSKNTDVNSSDSSSSNSGSGSQQQEAAAADSSVTPDIACYAKLLTGGVAPLAVTLSSEGVFDAFKGDSKIQALLHGHSYTAYPVGCAAAMASLALLQNPALNPNVCTPHVPSRCRRKQTATSGSDDGCSGPCGELLPVWDEAAAAELSHHPRVAGVVVLGSVLAVELAAASGGGGGTAGAGSYGSAAAVDVVAWLRERGVAARPLGPVVYMMATPTSSRQTCGWLLRQLREVLDQEEGVWAAAAAARGAGDEEGVLI